MGKFISTERRDVVEGITSLTDTLLNNDFYLFNSQSKGTKVTYYNVNIDKTTLDAGGRIAYTDIGKDSPIRFNKIHNLYIYQMQRLEVALEQGEFGMESSDITGESYILPNEITPYEGDFFMIDHAGQNWLFKVREVSNETLQTDTDAWKISWILDRTTNAEIELNVVEEYDYVEQTAGTNTKRVVLSRKVKLAEKIDNVTDNLRNYFKDLFYSEYVQTFIYKWYNEYHMYDPYAIEFILRNKLLQASGKDYTYIQHQTHTPMTFAVSYNRSIFRAFELHNIQKFRNYSYQAQANVINDPTSIFATRYENYFELCYDIIHEPNGPFNPRGIIPIMTEEFIDRIIENRKYGDEDKDLMYLNVIIKYFHNEEINEKDISYLDYIDITPQESLFYNLIMVIFVLDKYTEHLLN